MSGSAAVAASAEPEKPAEPKEAEADSGAVRKPNDSRFHQQRLPAWQPLLTAKPAFCLFFIIGIVFVPLGAFLLTTSQSVEEIKTDYTNCKNGSSFCLALVSTPEYYANFQSCQCMVDIKLPNNLTGQVYAYYALTNFYQNHRRYVKSRDDGQLQGTKMDNLLDDCNPYRQSPSGQWYAPCGAIANSLFNDTFQLFYNRPDGSGRVAVPWTSTGIAWDSDRPANLLASGDEELIVWMRTAALPSFRKLHRIIQHDSAATNLFKDGLPAGNYSLVVNYAYPVSSFAGTKSFILTTSTWLGGRNPALGIIYLVVGSLHVILGIIFVGVFLYSRKKHKVTLTNF
uniref:Transmembrane protein 30A n=2 Tax=Macrostomum lignano TaxID=282301 RepID=A0A1I8G503_9PLAT